MASTINLHIHTTYSDGGNTPAEIVAMLKEVGVTTFSITDHDTTDGNIQAAALAKEHGLTHINGIELSCCFVDGEIGLDESWVIHILGYGFDLDLMRDKLAKLDNKKHTQLRELFDLLVADGYNIDFERIAQDSKITERTYIARELIYQGYATDGNEAFAKILNTGRYRSYAKYKPSIKEGIKLIHDCGGLAVWAHPFGVTRGGKKDLTEKQVTELLNDMRDYGIDGMEVYYQQYTSEQIVWLEKQAEAYKLYKTVGTDYHNSNVNLSQHPEYAEAKNRERLAFDVVEVEPWFDAKLLTKIPKKFVCSCRAETDIGRKCILFLAKCNLLLIRRPSNRSYTAESGGCVSLNYYERDLQYSSAQHDIEYYYGFDVIHKSADEKKSDDFILNCECPSIAMSHIWIYREKFLHITDDYYDESETIDKLSKMFNIEYLEQLIQVLDYFLSQDEFETFHEILTSRAYSIARRAHEGQTDKSGVPYIEHAWFVAEQMDTDEEYIVAALHDVVEDTDLTFDELEHEGFPPSVISALKLLTHDDGGDYFDYVRRIKSDPLAMKVKLADLRHNSDSGRLASLLPETAERLKKKYTEAIRILEDKSRDNME